MANSNRMARVLGPSFSSQVYRINPNAQFIDMRQLLSKPVLSKQLADIPRELLPENIQYNYAEMVKSDHYFADIDKTWQGKTVGIIGAGAAGLCAGYELMRSGLHPVFFEMQLIKEDEKTGPARPGGRAYSYDFKDALKIDQKSIGDMGCMRYPKSHTTLRAYTDYTFKNEYRYHGNQTTKWPVFIDPLLYDSSGDIPQDDWKVVFDTAFMVRGVRQRKFYPVDKGATFASIDPAIRDVSTAFGELIFDSKAGFLTPIVNAYAKGDIPAITNEWAKLNERFNDKSIYEVLRDHNWDTTIVEHESNTSRLALFGEIGIGSGGFDAFWGTTFMEILRIKLHEDETDQSAFLGGSSYMLRPFLTHKTVDKFNNSVCLKDLTDSQVVTSPVIRIRPVEGGGVMVSTQAGKDYKFPIIVLTASPAAISSSILIDESLLPSDTWNGIRRMPLTGCGKIMVGFPFPFWKNSGSDAISTTITDYDIRQIYTFDDYHWGSGSPAGVLMMSYTWGDWAHKMGSLSPEEQVRSAWRMMQSIYKSRWKSEWDDHFESAIKRKAIQAINWSHERGFAGGYRMADLNRYPEQWSMWHNGFKPASNDSPVLLAGEAIAWLGLSGWVEGALHTGINATMGVGEWFKSYAEKFPNWKEMTDPDKIGTHFQPPDHPGDTPVISSADNE